MDFGRRQRKHQIDGGRLNGRTRGGSPSDTLPTCISGTPTATHRLVGMLPVTPPFVRNGVSKARAIHRHDTAVVTLSSSNQRPCRMGYLWDV